MAANDTAALVVSLSAQVSKFEKQMKDAGLIADRTVKDIEDKFSKANPAFGGTFLGSFLGNIASAGFSKLISFAEDMAKRFIELDRTAKLANVSMQELFGLQQAGAKLGVPIDDVTQSVKALAVLLDQMQRGEKNTLSALFDANPDFLKGVNRDTLTWQQAMEIVADLIRNARTEIQKIDIAKAAGQTETLVALLEKGGPAVAKLQKAAADTAPDLQRLANLAKEFDTAWKAAIDSVKAYMIENLSKGLHNLLAQDIDDILKVANFFKGGVFAGGPLDTSNADWVKKLENFRQALEFSRLADAFGPAGTPDRTLANRTTGNVEGGGTTTRDASRPLSNVPVTATATERDRFERAADQIEKRTAALVAENNAIDQGTAARERAKIAAELLAVAEQTNKGEPVTDEQIARINQLAEAYGRAALAIERSHSPLATFARDSANLEKQLNQFAATSLDGLTTALADVVTGTKTLKDAFTALAKSIINDLAKIAIRQAITGPIAGALFGAFGGGASPFAGPVGQTAVVGPLQRFASGTNNAPGGWAWVGENGPELMNVPRGSQVLPNDIAKTLGGPQFTFAPVTQIDASGSNWSREDIEALLTVRDRALSRQFEQKVPQIMARYRADRG